MLTNHGFTFEWESMSAKPIKKVIPSVTARQSFISLDQKTMRLFDQHRDFEVLKLERDNFIRVVLPLSGRRVYLAAALDMKFKIYDANLFLIGQFAAKKPSTNKGKKTAATLLSSTSSSNTSNNNTNSKRKNKGKKHKNNTTNDMHDLIGETGDNADSIRAVLCMYEDSINDEIITGGLSGCQRWRLSGDRFHAFTFTHLQTLPNSEGKWIDRMCDARAAKRLFCCHGDSVSVYAFQYVEGSHIASNGKPRARVATLTKSLHGIHDHSITGCLYNDVNSYLITSSLDLAVKVWSAASSYSLVHTFSGHSKSVTGLLSHPYPSLIVSCSLDCTLRVWNLDTLEEEYHLETTEQVQGMELGNASNHILVMTPTRVVSWRLHHIVTLFALCRSPVIALDCVPPPPLEPLLEPPLERTSHLIVARSRDHSVRLLTLSGDCLCTLLPDSAVTVMTKVLYAPSSSQFVGLLGPTGDIFAYSTTLGPMAILQWKVGKQVRVNHDKVNDIALCRLRLKNGGKKTYLVGATSKGCLYAWDMENDMVNDMEKDMANIKDKNKTNTVSSSSRLVQSQAVHKDAISILIFNSSSRNIVCFVPSAGILLVDDALNPLRTLTMEGTPFYLNRKMTPTTCVHMSRDHSLLLLGLENGSFQLFDVNEGTFDRNRENNVASFEHDASVTAASFFVEPIRKGILVATGGLDGCLKFWDIQKHLMCELPLTAAVNAVCFLPNGDIIFGEGQHVARVKSSTFGLHQMTLTQQMTSPQTTECVESNLVEKDPSIQQEVQQEDITNAESMVTNGAMEGATEDKAIEGDVNENYDAERELNLNEFNQRTGECTVTGNAMERTTTVPAVPVYHEATRPAVSKPNKTSYRVIKLTATMNYGRMIEKIPPPVGSSPSSKTTPWKHPLTTSKKEDGNTLLETSQAKKVTFQPVRRIKPKRNNRKQVVNQSGTEMNQGNEIRTGVFLPAFLPFSNCKI